MGPHSFKCGKLSKITCLKHVRVSLQWGRTLSSAERCVRRRRVCRWTDTSMGPHSFKCGKILIPSANRVTDSTSMGPHSFKCGKPTRRTTAASARFHFNGAALFQVRKASSDWRSMHGKQELQWGRTLSSAESFCSPPNRFSEFHFNGAALFQVRKGFQRQTKEENKPKLQWGRTLSSAESRKSLRSVTEF